MENINLENIQVQMRKGFLEFAILSVIAKEPVYASDILVSLKTAELLVVEGTLYPLLNRLKNAELLDYSWQESSSGPPRKYYSLTEKGKGMLTHLAGTWNGLNKSLKSINKARNPVK